MRLRYVLGLALGAVLIAGCGSAAAPPGGGPQSASGGSITFTPSTFSCAPASSAVVASAVRLPSSVTNSDRSGLTWQFDGAGISFGSGPLSSPIFVRQSDGSWLFADRTFVAYLCNNQVGQGIGQGPHSIGPHSIKVLDASGKVLAEGSFTVTQ